MFRFLRQELIIFLSSVRFNTRIIVPSWVEHSDELLASSTRYFPLVGWIVSAITTIVFYGSSFLFPVSVSVVLAVSASVLSTGAFHEDGFTDMCDGFGGGWDKERILEIMKDSRIGVFGTIGILLMLFLKVACYIALAESSLLLLFFAIWISHSSSRFSANVMAKLLPYAREDQLSKAKPIVKSMKLSDVLFSWIWVLGPIVFFLYYPGEFSNRIAMILLLSFSLQALGVFYLRGFYKKWLGGYTGDCLGAVQQVTEILFLLGLIATWKYY
ncbi:cobalamin-5-phosphate synthase [Leptospira broomii serovar Hurstbridge str. 5399]|uniref:Adenosylcobinamide-GDP ribazoletransferase n=1 Tax=Leptospira broomii serovar Hurstbridge str. 5399 TaxID=1049789 RepID=T0F0J2_9LEPT|nr:adenosylcobinamide-GDP ribazoletransferase [Leptospira broomii]EQA44660.1 cobalamin-5-phosphate synthase [Leptospira broomii serovar Hurstbridge str. 5399]